MGCTRDFLIATLRTKICLDLKLVHKKQLDNQGVQCNLTTLQVQQ